MKSILALLLLAQPSLTFANIMPEGVSQGMSSSDAIVTCVFENKNADFSEVNVSASGDLVLTTNTKNPTDNIAPFILFRGVRVLESGKTLLVQGQLLSLVGELDLDLEVARGEKTKVEFLEETLVCTAK